ncbi:MAG TPA: DUF2892 domain-containing protein [Bacteroidales bacterium]|jgi:hypothetical protein|nr:DUF2892 domain-containing protein [Bacteroidales bacterium]
MRKNMGQTDRIIRSVLAILLAVLYLAGAVDGILALVLLIIALIFGITGVIGFCPLYTLFGWNTMKK